MNRRQQGRLRRARIIPITYRTACEFIRTHHRHLVPPNRHRFSLGLTQPGGHLVAVATVGRPDPPDLDDGRTAEVTVLCTDAAPRAHRALLAAAWRTARAMGFQQMITYAWADQLTASLPAVGWRPIPEPAGRRSCARSPRPGVGNGPAPVLWRITVSERVRRPDPPRELDPTGHTAVPLPSVGRQDGGHDE